MPSVKSINVCVEVVANAIEYSIDDSRFRQTIEFVRPRAGEISPEKIMRRIVISWRRVFSVVPQDSFTGRTRAVTLFKAAYRNAEPIFVVEFVTGTAFEFDEHLDALPKVTTIHEPFNATWKVVIAIAEIQNVAYA